MNEVFIFVFCCAFQVTKGEGGNGKGLRVFKVKRPGADWKSGDGGVAVVAVGYKQTERVRHREWEKSGSEKVT